MGLILILEYYVVFPVPLLSPFTPTSFAFLSNLFSCLLPVLFRSLLVESLLKCFLYPLYVNPLHTMFNSTHVQHQHPPPVNSPYGFSKRLPSMNSTPNGAVDSHEAAGDTQEIAMYERHPQEPVRPLSSTSRSYSISHHQSPTASASMPSISSIPSSSSSSSSTSSSSSHDASGRIGSPKYSYAMSNSSGSDLHVLPRFQQPLTRPSPTQPHMSSESTTSTADDHPALFSTASSRH